jgi:hypothetical protein
MSLPTRAFTPIQNPTYLYNMDASFKATPQPQNVLERPAPVPRGVDQRLTAKGDMPRGNLPTFVPAAYQTPYNVWALYPA